MATCEKEGCEKAGSWSVILDAADGSMQWWACLEHAQAFRQWVINETNRLGENWAAVELEFADA